MCPVSGVVTNVMFPEFTNLTHSFEDIVYSQEHTSLVVLLKTHEGGHTYVCSLLNRYVLCSSSHSNVV